jgi:hypothetical protein
MKKKFVMGCLVVVAALLVVGGGAAYFYVIRPLTSTVKAGMELPKLAELDRQVRNKAPFSPPADELLQEQDLQRYLQVSDAVLEGLKGKAQELERKYDSLKNGQPGLRQIVSAYGDIIQVVVGAKELQVQALNAAGFSVDEYEWVRGSVLRAAGHDLTQINLAALAEGRISEARAATGAPPTANVDLIAPHAERVTEYAVLAAFGL